MPLICWRNWVICSLECHVFWIWLIISLWFCLVCSSIPCISSKVEVRPERLMMFTLNLGGQEDSCLSPYSMRHILFSCPTFKGKTDYWVQVVSAYFSVMKCPHQPFNLTVLIFIDVCLPRIHYVIGSCKMVASLSFYHACAFASWDSSIRTFLQLLLLTLKWNYFRNGRINAWLFRLPIFKAMSWWSPEFFLFLF